MSRCGVLREGVAAIRRGEAERIAGEFPQDVAPLAAELNLLLDANREVVERARTQVGNLAHALKTPLSVIVNEADSEKGPLSEKVREQAGDDARQVSYLPRPRPRRGARRRIGSTATRSRRSSAGLVRTFEKIYRDRELVFSVEAPAQSCAFAASCRTRPSSSATCSTMPANGRATRSSFRRARRPTPTPRGGHSSSRDRRRRAGPRPPARAAAMRRGRRLDETRPGSGLGLSIVVDLAAVYGGSLQARRKPARRIAGAPETAAAVTAAAGPRRGRPEEPWSAPGKDLMFSKRAVML